MSTSSCRKSESMHQSLGQTAMSPCDSSMRSPQQKVLINEMRRLKKSLQEIKSPASTASTPVTQTISTSTTQASSKGLHSQHFRNSSSSSQAAHPQISTTTPSDLSITTQSFNVTITHKPNKAPLNITASTLPTTTTTNITPHTTQLNQNQNQTHSSMIAPPPSRLQSDHFAYSQTLSQSSSKSNRNQSISLQEEHDENTASSNAYAASIKRVSDTFSGWRDKVNRLEKQEKLQLQQQQQQSQQQQQFQFDQRHHQTITTTTTPITSKNSPLTHPDVLELLQQKNERIQQLESAASHLEQEVLKFHESNETLSTANALFQQQLCHTSESHSIQVKQYETTIEELNATINNYEQEVKILSEKLNSLTAAVAISEKNTQSRLQQEQSQSAAALEDLNKLQKENIRLNTALKTARENLAIAGRNQNNTSSQQLLPSEFKSKWESLVTDQIANTFINFFEHPVLLTNILQDLFLAVHSVTLAHIESTSRAAMQLLKLPVKHTNLFAQQVAKLYQDFNADIFKIEQSFDDPQIQAVLLIFRAACQKAVTHTYKYEFSNKSKSIEIEVTSADAQPESPSNIDESSQIKQKREFLFEVNVEEFEQYVEELCTSDELLEFMLQLYQLCIYMHLNEPPLSLGTQPFEERVFAFVPFKKANCYLIDGFVEQDAPALTVIPPVLRNQQIYLGIKPSVILLAEDFVTPAIQASIDNQLATAAAAVASANLATAANTNKEKESSSAEKNTISNEQTRSLETSQQEMIPVSSINNNQQELLQQGELYSKGIIESSHDLDTFQKQQQGNRKTIEQAEVGEKEFKDEIIINQIRIEEYSEYSEGVKNDTPTPDQNMVEGESNNYVELSPKVNIFDNESTMNFRKSEEQRKKSVAHKNNPNQRGQKVEERQTNSNPTHDDRLEEPNEPAQVEEQEFYSETKNPMNKKQKQLILNQAEDHSISLSSSSSLYASDSKVKRNSLQFYQQQQQQVSQQQQQQNKPSHQQVGTKKPLPSALSGYLNFSKPIASSSSSLSSPTALDIFERIQTPRINSSNNNKNNFQQQSTPVQSQNTNAPISAFSHANQNMNNNNNNNHPANLRNVFDTLLLPNGPSTLASLLNPLKPQSIASPTSSSSSSSSSSSASKLRQLNPTLTLQINHKKADSTNSSNSNSSNLRQLNDQSDRMLNLRKPNSNTFHLAQSQPYSTTSAVVASTTATENPSLFNKQQNQQANNNSDEDQCTSRSTTPALAKQNPNNSQHQTLASIKSFLKSSPLHKNPPASLSSQNILKRTLSKEEHPSSHQTQQIERAWEESDPSSSQSSSRTSHNKQRQSPINGFPHTSNANQQQLSHQKTQMKNHNNSNSNNSFKDMMYHKSVHSVTGAASSVIVFDEVETQKTTRSMSTRNPPQSSSSSTLPSSLIALLQQQQQNQNQNPKQSQQQNQNQNYPRQLSNNKSEDENRIINQTSIFNKRITSATITAAATAAAAATPNSQKYSSKGITQHNTISSSGTSREALGGLLETKQMTSKSVHVNNSNNNKSSNSQLITNHRSTNNHTLINSSSTSSTTSASSKAYTFNTFLEIHRKNIKKQQDKDAEDNDYQGEEDISPKGEAFQCNSYREPVTSRSQHNSSRLFYPQQDVITRITTPISTSNQSRKATTAASTLPPNQFANFSFSNSNINYNTSNSGRSILTNGYSPSPTIASTYQSAAQISQNNNNNSLNRTNSNCSNNGSFQEFKAKHSQKLSHDSSSSSLKQSQFQPQQQQQQQHLNSKQQQCKTDRLLRYSESSGVNSIQSMNKQLKSSGGNQTATISSTKGLSSTSRNLSNSSKRQTGKNSLKQMIDYFSSDDDDDDDGLNDYNVENNNEYLQQQQNQFSKYNSDSNNNNNNYELNNDFIQNKSNRSASQQVNQNSSTRSELSSWNNHNRDAIIAAAESRHFALPNQTNAAGLAANKKNKTIENMYNDIKSKEKLTSYKYS